MLRLNFPAQTQIRARGGPGCTVLMLALVCVCCSLPAWTLELTAHGKIRAIIEEMVAEHGYDPGYLQDLFADVELLPEVIAAIKRPSERLPWYKYRKIFLTQARIEGGVEFLIRYKTALRRAELKFGVPSAIIVAIIGVETNYGRTMGKYPVIGSLTTLSLQYPQRNRFFTSELKQFLLLARDEQLPPLTVKGSYAGAMGIPQFMPSSYRNYSVDFSGDGKRDLVLDTTDAIGSVANYLYKHDWIENGPIASNVYVNDTAVEGLITTELSTTSSVGLLRRSGIEVRAAYPDATTTSLIRLEQDGEHFLYRAVFDNFYVITRYNNSVSYAMAVRDLGLALAKVMNGKADG